MRVTRLPTAVGIALSLAARSMSGQTPAADRVSPPGRAHHTIFYDEARQRVLLTGGGAVDSRRNSTTFNDLWSFDGSSWTALPPSGDSIFGTQVAVDAQRRIYSLGGFTAAPTADMRLLENDRWRRVGSFPSAVLEPGFVFDAGRNRFVAFGGGAGSGRVVSDTWEYVGETWTKVAAASPPARFAHVMVYDASRKRIVAFGGMGARRGRESAPILNDTWEFDGTTWRQLQVAAAPPPRLGAGAAYDSKRRVVLVFGGGNHDGVLNDLWSWDGSTWKKLAEGGPEPRVMGYIAYDPKRDRVVLFGGRRGTPDNTDLGDTWEWDGATWRRVAE